MASIDNLRVYEGAQGEYAACGDYSKGTYREIGSRTYGGEWHLYELAMTADLRAALDGARRVVSCG